MALVMLPCDLPWWPAVTKHLDKAAAAKDSEELADVMQRLHDMCNISLDPEEDVQIPGLFLGLVRFLEDDLTTAERNHVLSKTIPRIVNRAKALRSSKPPHGLHFSLQQQGDVVEHSYAFISSLIANAFFSTYPKRTLKTHPTLRDFNFTHFFKYLHINSQKAKLRSILHYFDFLETEHALDGRIVISRQVMLSKQWLTIDDWLESKTPLCPLIIRHEGRLDRIGVESKVLHICFSSSRLGGGVLEADDSQEAIHIATHPEMLAVILSVEALEDNEALLVEGLRHVSRIVDPRNRATFEAVPEPHTIIACCIDAEDYSQLPLTQFEEDNILRELNKSLLGFQQRCAPVLSRTDPRGPKYENKSGNPMEQYQTDGEFLSNDNTDTDTDGGLGSRRLSPIGESFSSASPEVEDVPEKAALYNKKSLSSPTGSTDPARTRDNDSSKQTASPCKMVKMDNHAGKRSRFIVLGSSGEALPVTRDSLAQMSVYSSCNSRSTDSFHSARESVDQEPEYLDKTIEKSEQSKKEEEEKLTRRYSGQLDTPERRGVFVQHLKDALKHENSTIGMSSDNSSTDSSYAVGINVTGSQLGDKHITLKRGGSTGFVLRNESVDEEFLNESLEAEQRWLGRFRQSHQTVLQRKDTSASSKYSFSTEYSSELEEVYEQLSKWLEDPISSNEGRELDARDKAVVLFAGSLLKRALSESLAGVPVQEGEPQPLLDSSDVYQKHKLALAVRSLSLELARQKNKRLQSTYEGIKTRETYCDAFYDVESSPEESDKNNMTCHRDENAEKELCSKLRAFILSSQVFQTLAEDEVFITLPSKIIDRKVELNDFSEKNSTSHTVKPSSKIIKRILSIPRENTSPSGNLLPIATGNWGCGSRLKGNPQLKLVIQWLAASIADVPKLIYYTSGHPAISKLDTVSRILTDRHWTVGDLVTATLRFALQTLHERIGGRNTLFEELIGMDKPSP